MPVIEFRSLFEHPAQALWAFHAQPGAFSRLGPPWQRLGLVSWEGGIRDGGRLDFDILGPLGVPVLRWTAVHEGYVEGVQFRDRQERGPFKAWLHTHRVEARGEGRSELIDHIEYTPPFGVLGAVGDRLKLKGDLDRMFAWRHRRTADDVARHALFADRERLRVVVTGTSGLIGSALCAYLSNAGHRVDRLVRRVPRRVVDGSGLEFFWDPAAGVIDQTPLNEADAVIHLGGVGIGSRRWNAGFLEAVRASRVESTALLARTLAAMGQRGGRGRRALLVASGTAGVPAGTARVDERAGLDTSSVLGGVVRDWEAAAEPARQAGLRVVNLRMGLVLAAHGGALAKLAGPFGLGLGGRIGSGEQMVSWIGLDDLLGAIEHVLHSAQLEGPAHCVAPEPVSNEVFTATLARVLRRPRLMPMPGGLLRALAGGVAEELLRSTPAVPGRLMGSGMVYRYGELESCLRMELGRLR